MTTLLFDFGGTIDTNGVHWSEKFRDAYAREGISMDKQTFGEAYVAAESCIGERAIAEDEGFRTVLQVQAHLQVEALCERGIVESRQRATDLPARIASSCLEDVENTITQIRPLLSRWSNTMRLGLVSNFYGNLAVVCEELGIVSLFDAIVDSTRVHIRKPDPGIFRIALEMLQASAVDTCMIGDSYDRDIVPAKGLGCTTVWLRNRPWHTPLDVSQADYTVTSLHELQACIDERNHHEERQRH